MAQDALNIDLWSKEARPIKSPLQIEYPTKPGTILSIYPLGGKWLHWTTDVDVARAPLSLEGQDERIYYSGDLQPKATDVSLATVGSGTDYPLDYYRLGIPAPETAPTVTPDGSGTGASDTRSYVYTFVTEWGEEGPPSAATEATGKVDDVWNITGLDTTPLNSGSISGATYSGGIVTVTVTANHFLETGDWVDISGVVGMTDLNGRWQITRISATQFSVVLTTSQTYSSGGTWTREARINTTNMTKRIYRTVAGVFRLVDEVSAATTSYADSKADPDLAEELPSTEWISPPANLNGLRALPNGVLCGFFDNVLAFSEPYIPHAWPISYQIKFEHPVVAIGSFGNTVVVATEGYPYIVTGMDPGSMSDARLEIFQACVSKRSMVSLVNGVIYASPDGLVYVPGAGVPTILTREWMKKEDWELFNPSSIVATVYDDRYYGFFTGGGKDGNYAGGIVFDPAEAESTFTTIGNQPTAAYSDIETDSMYLMDGTTITKWASGGSYLTYQWKSKKFTSPKPICFKAAKVRMTVGSGFTEAERQAAIDAAVQAVDDGKTAKTIWNSGAFNGFSVNQYDVNGGPYVDAIQGLGAPQTAVFKLYANEKLVFTKNLSDSKPFRIPGGYLADTWEIEISGTDVTIHEVMLAETMAELAAA